MDYMDRRTTGLAVSNVNLRLEDGKYWVGGNVDVRLSNYEGKDIGPILSLLLSVPAEETTTFLEAETMLLAAIPALLKRFATETEESLLSRWKEKGRRDRLPIFDESED